MINHWRLPIALFMKGEIAVFKTNFSFAGLRVQSKGTSPLLPKISLVAPFGFLDAVSLLHCHHAAFFLLLYITHESPQIFSLTAIF